MKVQGGRMVPATSDFEMQRKKDAYRRAASELAEAEKRINNAAILVARAGMASDDTFLDQLRLQIFNKRQTFIRWASE